MNVYQLHERSPNETACRNFFERDKKIVMVPLPVNETLTSLISCCAKKQIRLIS